MFYQNKFSSFFQVVNALVKREIKTRFGKNKFGYLWAILEPLSHVIVFFLIFKYIKNTSINGVEAYAFISLSIISWFILTNAYKRSVNAISSNQGLLNYKQVTYLKIFVSRAILEYYIFMFLFVFFLISMYCFSIQINYNFLFMYLFLTFILSIIGVCFGIIVSFLENFVSNVNTFFNVLLRILYFSSAIFYPLNIIPKDYLFLFELNPFAHIIELCRYYIFEAPITFNMFSSFLFIFYFSSILLIISFYIVRDKKRVKISNLYDKGFVFEKVMKTFQIKNHKHIVLKKFDLVIPYGKNIAILGKNGKGKSTLLKMISGIEGFDKGHIKYNKRLSWVMGLSGGFQGSLSGYDNVKFIARINNVSEKDLSNLLNYVKDFSELGDYFYEKVNKYSNGMKARLGFAISTAFDFEYYIIDEIIAVGDKDFKTKCTNYIEDLSKKRHLIVVNHDLNFLEKYCEVAIIINNGEVLYFDDITEALNYYKNH